MVRQRRARALASAPIKVPEDIVEGPASKPVPLLVLHADPDEREEGLSIGHPFFASRADRDRIAVLLTGDTGWEEIREVVTDSHHLAARPGQQGAEYADVPIAADPGVAGWRPPHAA